MEVISRKDYAERLDAWLGKGQIIVLVGQGYTVKVGQLRASEIDFICTKSGKKVYVQVSYIITDEETRKREFGNLRLIPDDYPKYVISASPLLKRSDDDGVTHIHIREFLKNGL